MHNTGASDSVPKIDHVGIAVNSLEAALPRWIAVLGAEPAGRETVRSEGVRVAFFGDGSGRIELLEPLDDDSPIARFLARRGPGLHHVCLAVDDLEKVLGEAEAAGLEAIPPRIRPGSEGARVAFLHPRTLEGILLELREAPAGP